MVVLAHFGESLRERGRKTEMARGARTFTENISLTKYTLEARGKPEKVKSNWHLQFSRGQQKMGFSYHSRFFVRDAFIRNEPANEWISLYMNLKTLPPLSEGHISGMKALTKRNLFLRSEDNVVFYDRIWKILLVQFSTSPICWS